MSKIAKKFDLTFDISGYGTCDNDDCRKCCTYRKCPKTGKKYCSAMAHYGTSSCAGGMEFTIEGSTPVVPVYGVPVWVQGAISANFEVKIKHEYDQCTGKDTRSLCASASITGRLELCTGLKATGTRACGYFEISCGTGDRCFDGGKGDGGVLTLSLPTSRVGRVKRGSVILPVLSFAIWCETSWHFAFGRQRQESPVSQEVTLTRSLAFQRLSMSTMPFRKNMAMKILDNQTWVQLQFANAQLGDPRRTRRLGEIATSMLDAPDQSLPQQNPN